MMELIVFGEDWNRHPSSSQHLIKCLAQHYQVTWINSIGLRRPTCRWQDLKRVYEKIKQQYIVSNSNSVFPVISPLVFPLPKGSWIKKLNQYLLNRSLPIKKNRRIVWIALPSAYDYLPILQADVVIYYCGDDFQHLVGVDHQPTHEKEQALIQQADLIFCASEVLTQKFISSKTHYLPHGVHIDSFAPTSLSRPKSQPSQVGFYGSLNQWIDWPLLLQLANARPHIQFHLIGRQDCDLSPYQEQPNIFIHPPCAHHALPAYLHQWDAALLPFLNNGQITACNPLKLREYLASGCPIISSDFPSARSYQAHIHMAKTTNQWLNALDICCQMTSQQRQQRYQAVREQLNTETWEHRAQYIHTLIQQQIKQ